MRDSFAVLFYQASQSLLIPVMICLAIAMMATLVLLGQTVRSGVEGWLVGRKWRRYVQAVRTGEASALNWVEEARGDLPRWCAAEADKVTDAEDLPWILAKGELLAAARLTRFQMLIRTGPMLGLVGTLIPLGPALQGISSANLSQVGQNLNIAFTTTVFGIAIAAIAYLLFLCQRQWYDRDLLDLEFIFSKLQSSSDAS